MTISTSIDSDTERDGYFSQPRGFLTPQPTWRSNRCFPATARSETKPRRTPDRFHVIHKIPSGDSPYVRAKHVQLVDKDPGRAVSLFWAAINSGDRVDSALKDMAVVMKQLDRSDEAIEAIKSFRHLSPLESQESLDNILVELYKQSGRIEEEIEMLQRKLKQVEEIALSGKRTKFARSQGKKVQITVEKDYSRLLGNLAWAYMQNKDFKSAEEYYRKALSIEQDKNKQCNLAVCLMHMNRLTEAKFLLQTVRFSSASDCVDEQPYAKSYERASEILAEFESQKETGQVRGQWDSRFCSQKKSDDNNGVKSSPLPPPIPVQTNSGSFTEFPYEKRANFEPQHCYGNIPKVPYTQPRRVGDHRKGRSNENACGGGYCRKLSFDEQLLVNQKLKYLSEKQDSVKPVEATDSALPSDVKQEKNLSLVIGKSWADMVEEDEELEHICWKNDENVDSNINHETPMADEKLCQKMELIDFGSGYITQPEKTARRSLCFDYDTLKVDDLSCSSSSRRRRLKVFQDITDDAGI